MGDVSYENCESLTKHLLVGNYTTTLYLGVFVLTATVIYLDRDSKWYKNNTKLAKAIPFIVTAVVILIVEILAGLNIIPNLGIINLFRDRAFDC